MAEATKLKRPPFAKRTIRLIGTTQVDTSIAMLRNCPLDADKPLLLTLGEEPRARTLDQNAAYHAGPLRDIEQQAWIDGRQFSAEVLHEHFKFEYLPDENLLTFEELSLRVKDPVNYRKWDTNLRGERVCVGSTTQLTKFGFGEYMDQVQAFGAALGVQFSAAPGRA